ncbi:hypothetical protein ACSMXN_20295 [Jatrophihabitans sp. DSM 45814]
MDRLEIRPDQAHPPALPLGGTDPSWSVAGAAIRSGADEHTDASPSGAA